MAKDYLKDKDGYIKNCLNNKNTELSPQKKNRAYNNLLKWYRAFENNLPEAEEFLRPLILNPDENYSVACWASAHAFGLGILTKESVNLFEEILTKYENDELKTLEARWNHISAEVFLDRYKKGEKTKFLGDGKMSMFKNENYTDDDREELLTIIENSFGEHSTILHEIVFDYLHIDVVVIPPTQELNFYKLFTIGMGSKKMNTSPQLERAELAVFISPKYDFSINDIKKHWIVNFLKTVARFPFNQNTWLGEGHTVDLSKVGNFGNFSGALLLSLQSEEEAIVLDSNKSINFYLTVPIFYEEMKYKNMKSYDELLDLFDSNGITPVVNFNRINCCK